jgi:hypothetical protein
MEGLKTVYDKVAWLMTHVPATRDDYILLILLYWQTFDGIDIPAETVKQILESATEPETINRVKRKVIEYNFHISNIKKMIEEVAADGK